VVQTLDRDSVRELPTKAGEPEDHGWWMRLAARLL
jgi:hypothetical protein